jgi:hypothetical protein
MAQQLNLDRSQRVDIVCRRNDTFTLNLELKDEAGIPLVLGSNQDNIGTNGTLSPAAYYKFKMQVRLQDTFDGAQAGDPDGYALQMDGAISSTANGLVTFTSAHGAMVIDSGLYVYDIQKQIGPNDNNTAPDSVETILYGTFKVNEDVTVGI